MFLCCTIDSNAMHLRSFPMPAVIADGITFCGDLLDRGPT